MRLTQVVKTVSYSEVPTGTLFVMQIRGQNSVAFKATLQGGKQPRTYLVLLSGGYELSAIPFRGETVGVVLADRPAFELPEPPDLRFSVRESAAVPGNIAFGSDGPYLCVRADPGQIDEMDMWVSLQNFDLVSRVSEPVEMAVGFVKRWKFGLAQGEKFVQLGEWEGKQS